MSENMLQKLLFGDFVPPPISQTRVIKFDKHYVLKPATSQTANAVAARVSITEEKKRKIINFIGKRPGALVTDIRKVLKLSSSYAHRIMADLVDARVLVVRMGNAPPTGGARVKHFYLPSQLGDKE